MMHRPPAWLLAVLMLPVAAQAGERFRLVSASKPSALERRLRSAADDGYAIVRARQGVAVDGKRQMVLLMERGSNIRGLSEYAVPAFGGDFDGESARDAVNVLASSGYRLDASRILVERVDDFWLPQTAYDDQIVLIMEKPAGSTPHAYDALIFKGYERFREELDAHREQGYRAIGLVNSARRLRVVLEKPLEGGEAAGDDAYQLLIGAKNLGTKRKLNRAARQGYRIVSSVDQSVNAPPMILLALAAPADDEFEYEFMRKPAKKIRRDKLEKKLNKKARKGYRVDATGITPTLITLHRTKEDERRWKYRALSSLDPPGLVRALEEAAGAGYGFVEMFLTDGEIVVVVERRIA